MTSQPDFNSKFSLAYPPSATRSATRAVFPQFLVCSGIHFSSQLTQSPGEFSLAFHTVFTLPWVRRKVFPELSSRVLHCTRFLPARPQPSKICAVFDLLTGQNRNFHLEATTFALSRRTRKQRGLCISAWPGLRR